MPTSPAAWHVKGVSLHFLTGAGPSLLLIQFLHGRLSYSAEQTGVERNSSVTLFYGTEPVQICVLPHTRLLNVALCIEIL